MVVRPTTGAQPLMIAPGHMTLALTSGIITIFFAEQPDLNWRNPQVKQAMWDAVRFWLDMGVDGFRLDAIGTIFEDPDTSRSRS